MQGAQVHSSRGATCTASVRCTRTLKQRCAVQCQCTRTRCDVQCECTVHTYSSRGATCSASARCTRTQTEARRAVRVRALHTYFSRGAPCYTESSLLPCFQCYQFCYYEPISYTKMKFYILYNSSSVYGIQLDIRHILLCGLRMRIITTLTMRMRMSMRMI